MFTLLLMFAYLLSSVNISMSIYRPFKKLRADLFNILDLDIKGENNELGSEHDLELISDNLVKIKAEYDSMQETELLYSETMLNELIYNITVGAYNYDKKEMDEYCIHFPHKYNTVALFRLDNTANIDRSNIRLIIYGIANAGIELLTDSNTIAYFTTYSNEYDIIFLINHTSAEFDTVKLSMIQKYASTAFSITVSAAYDTSDEGVDSITQLYRNVNSTMQYRLIHGHNCMISYKGLLSGLNIKCDYPAKYEKAVIREINQKNLEGATAVIDSFINEISNMPYHYIIIHSSVLMMTLSAHTVHDSNSIEDDVISSNLTRVETIEEIRTMLLAKCNDAIISASDIEINHKHFMIANLIEEYINKHYTDPNLSIDVIASHVNKSANYTRSIFKQNKNISISDYITKKRFDEVCRMLIEINLTAQAIAGKNGMNPGSYFYTAFKKYTGYTPEQYRKTHMKD